MLTQLCAESETTRSLFRVLSCAVESKTTRSLFRVLSCAVESKMTRSLRVHRSHSRTHGAFQTISCSRRCFARAQMVTTKLKVVKVPQVKVVKVPQVVKVLCQGTPVSRRPR